MTQATKTTPESQADRIRAANAVFVNPAEDASQAFETSTWRLVIDPEARSGPANMAIDQAIAEACAKGQSLPTLRFYRWQPPAVSLGRHQPIADVDLAATEALGYEVVRRPTGGRAILHTDELTYSVAAAKDEARVKGGVMDAYLRLSNALLRGLTGLGVGVSKAAGNVRAGSDVSAACFEVPSAYEITASGRKLMGSAQSRRAGYVLQHGSLPLTGDLGRLVDVLALPEPEARLLRSELTERACTLAQALGVDDDSAQVNFETVAAAIRQGFAEELNLEFSAGALSATELQRASELIRTQFASLSWTQSR